jgi:uncharacterized delta-60 repeat protein
MSVEKRGGSGVLAFVCRSFCLALAATTVLFVPAATAAAAPGQIDWIAKTEFRFFSVFANINALAVQPDGRLVGGGQLLASTTSFGLARYLPDGSLDASFGPPNTGTVPGTVVSRPAPGVGESVNDLVLQPDGKIVVGGFRTVPAGGTNFVLARYLADGSLDPSFGSGGFVVTDLPASVFESVCSLAVQPDGKIIAAGMSGGQSGSYFCGFGVRGFTLVRYQPDGTVDGSFGAGGVVTSFGGSQFGAGVRDLVLTSHGRFVAGGVTWVDGVGERAALAGYLEDGSLDPAFGTGGLVVSNRSVSDEIRGLERQTDGKLVAAGSTSNLELLITRYAANGQSDTSFGTNGAVIDGRAFGGSFAVDVALQPNGKIVAVGRNGFGGLLVVLRLLPDGANDSSFGSDGLVTTPFGALAVGAVAVDPRGGILVGGASNGFFVAQAFTLVRYFGDPVDVTPPTLILPGTVEEDATSPEGAHVDFAVSASDDTDPNPVVVCSPSSGSLFPIGTSIVNCSATDAAGNTARGSFEVRVRGALEQLVELLDHIRALELGAGGSLALTINSVIASMERGDHNSACRKLDAFLNAVDAQTETQIDSGNALRLVQRGQRISAVLAC